MTINLQLPKNPSLKPTITVFGVGGAGGNAVNNMISSNLEGVNFVIANTDAQAVEQSLCESRIQLGESITQGLGAGSYPEVGKASAEESVEQILDYLNGSNMVFITAGLGGGTGTGAAPVVARLAREQGILTVAVVTKPFHFEGTHRMRVAELGLQELQKYVDTMIVIPNQNLFRVADKNTTFLGAFKLADNVLYSGVRGITDLMVMPGLINLDFSDVRAVMSEMGKAMMGTGEAEGEKRAVEAAEAAIANPLLDNVSMKGAKGVLINITGGGDMTLFEVDEAANRIREEVDPEANIIFGSTYDKDLEGKIRVSVVATGIESVSSASEHKSGGQSAPSYSEQKKVNIGGDYKQPTRPQQAAVARSFADIAAAAPNEEKEETGYNAESDSFVPPEPVEPKPYIAPSSSVAPRVQKQPDAYELSRKVGVSAESEHDESAEKSRKLFGGFFGKRVEDAPEGRPNPEQRISDGYEDDGADESARSQAKPKAKSRDGLLMEDELDIPAFLRRRSG